MTVLIRTPKGRDAAWDYICEVIFGDWLGLEWARISNISNEVQISVAGAPGELALPSCLLSLRDDAWLTPQSLPPVPLRILERGSSSLPQADDLPIIFGVEAPLRVEPDKIWLPIDILGSAFFMLSRYEELVSSVRDAHDRFPCWASLAIAADIIDRPLIDEYVELLWTAISTLWPALKRRESSFQMVLSHDVDAPLKYPPRATFRLFRAIAADVVKHRRIEAVLNGPRLARAANERLPDADPFNTFDWIMDLSEAHSTRSAFYLIAGRTVAARDAAYEVEAPAIRDLLRRIHGRGHEVGLHPSYGSYQSPRQIRLEADRLRRVCGEEGIEQEVWGGRMHYLRWDVEITARAWAAAGMAYDSTLGFADRAGFRCGCARPFKMFSLTENQSMNLIERPLIAMECSVIADRYMGLGYGEEALSVFSRLKDACRKVRGEFTLLWHNSHLATAADREIYRAVLAA